MRVYIATSRPIGERCKEWAKAHCPEGVHVLDSMYSTNDIFISVLYDKLLDESDIKKYKACYNFHPGLLPDYRGAGAYSWVLINGEKQTGVTLHYIDKDIDHGRIIEKRAFAILPEDTAQTLFNAAERMIFTMFQDWWLKIVSGEKLSHHPNEGGHIYYRKDLEKAKDLTRFVKAFTFEGKENAYYTDKYGVKRPIKYDPTS